MVETSSRTGAVLPQDFRADSTSGSKDKVAQRIQNFLEYRDRGYVRFAPGNEIRGELMEVASTFGGRHVWITHRSALEDADAMLRNNPGVDVGVVDAERAELGHQTTIIEAESLTDARKQNENPKLARVVRIVESADLVIVEEVEQALEADTEGKNLLNLFPIAVVIGTTSTDVASEIGLIEEKFGPLINKPEIEDGSAIEGEEVPTKEIPVTRKGGIPKWELRRRGQDNIISVNGSGNGVDDKSGSEKKDCTHHWVIASPNGPESPGKCIHCNTKRMFPNGLQWNWDGPDTYSNDLHDYVTRGVIRRSRDRSMNDEY